MIHDKFMIQNYEIEKKNHIESTLIRKIKNYIKYNRKDIYK